MNEGPWLVFYCDDQEVECLDTFEFEADADHFALHMIDMGYTKIRLAKLVKTYDRA